MQKILTLVKHSGNKLLLGYKMQVNHQKVAVVTGASRGIGKQTAILLAQNKFKVCVNFNKNESAAYGVVDAIVSAGGSAIAVQADISNENQIMQMFDIVDHKLGLISALVNNAGVLFTQSAIENLNADRINAVLKTNITGTIICCREAVKRMAYKHGGNGGCIVNVSSRAAILGSANEYIDYAASKGAVDSLTIGLANEVAGQGIRVNAVRPGLIYTEMHKDGGEPDRVDRLKTSIPMKRGGNANEVAEAIHWLLSDKSSYSTGTFIDVSGGR